MQHIAEGAAPQALMQHFPMCEGEKVWQGARDANRTQTHRAALSRPGLQALWSTWGPMRPHTPALSSRCASEHAFALDHFGQLSAYVLPGAKVIVQTDQMRTVLLAHEAQGAFTIVEAIRSPSRQRSQLR